MSFSTCACYQWPSHDSAPILMTLTLRVNEYYICPAFRILTFVAIDDISFINSENHPTINGGKFSSSKYSEPLQ